MPHSAVPCLLLCLVSLSWALGPAFLTLASLRVHIFLFHALGSCCLQAPCSPPPAGFEIPTISDEDVSYQPGVVSAWSLCVFILGGRECDLVCFPRTLISYRDRTAELKHGH